MALSKLLPLLISTVFVLIYQSFMHAPLFLYIVFAPFALCFCLFSEGGLLKSLELLAHFTLMRPTSFRLIFQRITPWKLHRSYFCILLHCTLISTATAIFV
ncbi:hypothetical protein Ahy_B05g079267 isoform B [Arachis hypogaea]|uniref:Uncharacterized protein n=1 Tax=Arachis hypogaea TaxID=3818 RepID=A0A444Z9C8_ARAHY|nr:hypothetical protein Ahy_B05g079267 isoform B [Arachis hypogaea]